MWKANPMALAVIGHGALRLASSSASAIGSTASSGTAGQAFDGSTAAANGFLSNEANASCVGVSFLGQNFGLPLEVRRIEFWPYNGTADFLTSSIKIQYSFDGSTWVDHTTISASITSTTVQGFDLPRLLRAQYWRALCNATPNAAGGRFGYSEILMYVKT